ncbi:DNA topoisomerase I [Candidatus Marsarchaeota archaeon]|nr:DNA topoisomerase I [Candidatus Marsarchaeota archaeon]MCL5100236.1 DNA topoisomerase I [Candidatus Marsarchaeota archaeon]
MGTLIIAEKPSVALRIAIALGNGAQRRIQKGRVGYFEIDGKERTYVAAAVGHLFTVRQKGTGHGYPIMDVEWAPSYLVSKSSYFTKEYLDTLKEVAKECSAFVNACDYDTEGTVIGTNIIKELSALPTDRLAGVAKRMKFSTTTTRDLLAAYSELSPLDMDNFYAGEARHILDWIWGINLSRALTSALSGSVHMPLSIGRVQGPSLALLAKRELEIAAFVPKPFWKVIAAVNGVDFTDTKGEMFDKSVAEKAYEAANAHKDSGMVMSVEEHEDYRRAFPPFDLTSLQIEASRSLHLDPSVTLSLAQSLYERSYISYPRTSSQKLPGSLGLPRILEDLSKNPTYSELASRLVSAKRFRPVEGAKVDEAHPAIFPTGVVPKALSAQEAKLYDLIVRRFMACFAEEALIATSKVAIDFGVETFSASGARIKKKGWMEYYTFARVNEKELPAFVPNSVVHASSMEQRQLETQPPRRYSKASIISELEKHGLGTKATRAGIVDTLFRRNYVEGSQIKVTEFGMTVYNALEKNCEMIVREETTRRLEDDMESIAQGKKSEGEVIEEGKAMLLEAIKTFDTNKAQIAEAMKTSLMSASVIGKCPKCGGDLVIRRSKIGKQFVSCSNYPKCTVSYPLPQNAKIVPTGEVCPHCHTPIVKVIRRGRPPFEIDLDPTCVSKKEFMAKLAEKKAQAAAKKDETSPPRKKRKPAAKKAARPAKKPAKGVAAAA